MHETPRQRFFPPGIDQSTPDNQAVPLGGGRTLAPQNVVEMMLRGLDLEGSERVLVVAGGSGYLAALLGGLAREVVSVDHDDEHVRAATSTLSQLGRDNVRVVHGDVLQGWKERAPYQGIVVGAAAAEIPPALVEQLDLGGRLVIPLGDSGAQLIQRFYKRVDNLDSQTIGACRLDVLPYFEQKPSYFPWARHRQSR
jgi:protein-L-isoaspartate(D-aspartate) O-methyltransferase